MLEEIEEGFSDGGTPMARSRSSQPEPLSEREIRSRYVRESSPSPRSMMSTLTALGFKQVYSSSGRWEGSVTYDGKSIETKSEYRIYSKEGSDTRSVERWKALEDGIVAEYQVGFSWDDVRSASSDVVSGTVNELRLFSVSPVGGTKERRIQTDRDWKAVLSNLDWKENWTAGSRSIIGSRR